MLAVGGIGIMYSTIIRKTIVAMIATYGTMIFLAGVTGFIYLVITGINTMGGAGTFEHPHPSVTFLLV